MDALNLAAAAPEIFLAVMAMALLLVGAFNRDQSEATIGWLAIVVVMVAAGMVMGNDSGEAPTAMFGQFINDPFARFLKLLITAGALLSLMLALDWFRTDRIGRFEFPILVLFSVIGMMMMVSANSLMALYVGLELQSLSLYLIAAYNRDSAVSTEAGIKYFVLGALASGLLLYGASLVYGFAGTVSFPELALTFAEMEASGDRAPVGLLIGLVFIMSGLAFKVSAVPFHMWTPDVYEGAPTPVTAFFSITPKLAAMGLFVRLMVDPFGGLVADWQQVVEVVAVLSMAVGAFAAIQQTNIKRLMAYSSIGHVGYALVGLAVGDAVGVRGVLIYLAIYLFMTAGTFAVILSMRRAGQAMEAISDLSGLARLRPAVALALSVMMFSMAGIPPLAGFFSKLYVFKAAVDGKLYYLAVVGVLTSVVAAYYYLRIVKIMYFDEPSEGFDKISRPTGLVLAGSTAVVMVFVVAASSVVTSADAAARALLGG